MLLQLRGQINVWMLRHITSGNTNSSNRLQLKGAVYFDMSLIFSIYTRLFEFDFEDISGPI